MIEVEKKIAVENDAARARLLEGATFCTETTNDDVYYDDDAYTLTKTDRWFRYRNGGWELKVPLHQKGDIAASYDELENEDAIKNALGFSPDLSMQDALEQAGINAFARLVTTRRQYRFGEMTIDLDHSDLDGIGYDVGEIELMVEDTSQVKDALGKIEMFLQARALPHTSPRGKILEYIFRNRAQHYQALVDAGVVQYQTTP